MTRLPLLPMPRSVEMMGGMFRLAGDMYIVLDPHPATRDIFAAERFVIEAETLTATRFHITVGGASIEPAREIRARFDASAAGGHPQGYATAYFVGGNRAAREYGGGDVLWISDAVADFTGANAGEYREEVWQGAARNVFADVGD